MKISYELSFKTIGHAWKVFDSYKSINDPDLKKYYKLLGKMKFNESVRVVKLKSTRELIDFDGDEIE